ncbi:MAG: hypothetical protein EOP08_13570, partial [Proteobacteria bacterium]
MHSRRASWRPLNRRPCSPPSRSRRSLPFRASVARCFPARSQPTSSPQRSSTRAPCCRFRPRPPRVPRVCRLPRCLPRWRRCRPCARRCTATRASPCA